MRRANRPATDESGWATGIVVSCEEGTAVQQTKTSRDDIDDQTYAVYNLTVAADSVTGDPINMRLQTGTTLNDEPQDQKGRGKQTVNIYNRLTHLVLSLGLLKETDLKTLSDQAIEKLEKEFLNLEGTKVKFKLAKIKGKNFHVIDYRNIKIVK